MIRITTILFAMCLPVCSLSAAEPDKKSTERPPAKNFCVAAYCPEWEATRIDPAQGSMVTDLLYFSIEPKANGELNTRNLNARLLTKLQEMKKANKGRLLLCLGGWGQSKGFGPMATDEKARQLFVKNITELCVENKFDGVDLDWEFPANKAEEEAYATLLIELKEAFGPKKMMVTAATGARQNLPARAYAALDRIHIMSYDHGGKHATFEQAKADVKFLLDKKVPAEKICLGMPFYGRNTKDRKESPYRKLVQDNHPSADVDEVAGVYFNGIKTIQEKTRYAKENDLAGVMIWELGEDTMDETSLLRAIGEVVGKK